jgi:protein required for attachment to host cells
VNRICIAVADATRARLYTFEELAAPPGERTQEMRERVTLVHPARRMRPSQLFSDPRPGSDRAPNGRTFGLDDHREASLRHMDRQFAVDIVEEIRGLARAEGFRRVVLAASPRMLGILRELTGPLVDAGMSLQEIDRDLVRLSIVELHDRLSDQGLLPVRERISSQAPQPHGAR